jgi:serine phosphatase RsbU (regulator of sigma subunit)
MALHLTVLAASPQAEDNWVRELKAALGGAPDIEVAALSKGHGGGEGSGNIWFVDASFPDLDAKLETIDRRGKALFLIVRDGHPAPPALVEGRADDVLIHPFRGLEVLSKLKHYQQLLLWHEITRLNASFSDLIGKLKDDVGLAERMQKAKLPSRFKEVRGFKVQSRYLAGLKSGGDHFDLAETRDGQQLSIVLSDATTYGLAGAVLSALMSVAVKLSQTELRSARETVEGIYDELANVLSDKARLSLFYGLVSRKDLTLKYLNLGTSSAFYSADPSSAFQLLPSQGAALAGKGGVPAATESLIQLQPQDRLALISDGFVDAAGGPEATCKLLDGLRGKESVDALNELVYRVKSRFTQDDDMPEQDCTAVIFDTDARVLRLTRG